jgi:CHAT domain-containing protein
MWLTTSNDTQFRELKVTRAELRRTAKRFAAECSDSASSLDNLRLDGKELYSWLLAPLGRQISGARVLIIEADPNLPLIPFEALVDGRGHFLAESHAVAYTLGAAFLQRSLPNPAQLFAGKALVVAPGLGKSEITPLPESIREARDVAIRFRQGTFLEGSNATPGVVKRKLSGISVFHFAGHASATPGRTGLLLASDTDSEDAQASVLTPEEIGPDRLANLDLVVLSACSTAQIPDEESSEVAGLSQDFLLAGGKTVVGNKWAADSNASEMLIRTFYDRLRVDGSPVVALGEAQSQLRVQKEFAHPFYWCAPSVWI